jgi:tRNA-specific 2-thiouridylase
VHRFTVGQRKGLGVALGKPAFVTRIDADTATVHLGDDDRLHRREATLVDVVLAEGLRLPMRARVRVRYRHDGETATVEPAAPGVRVIFDAPVRAITPGQIAVLYDDERVIGGGRIVDERDAARVSALSS